MTVCNFGFANKYFSPFSSSFYSSSSSSSSAAAAAS